jgi:hypothetical protein
MLTGYRHHAVANHGDQYPSGQLASALFPDAMGGESRFLMQSFKMIPIWGFSSKGKA